MRAASAAELAAERRAVYAPLHMLDAIFDDERAAGAGPLRRTWDALPGLARRLLR
jgi:hypothetical protein